MNRQNLVTTPDMHLQKPSFSGEEIPVTQVDKPQLGLIIGTGQHQNQANGTRRFDLCSIDLDNPSFPLTLISMHFFGHGITPDPTNPALVSVFEKRGRGACEIDLKQGAVTRTFEPATNRKFYGHGAYSPNGKLLFCTETIVEDDYEGLIAVRDAKTHEYLGEFPSYGSSPHDCHLIDSGATMVITNGGGPMKGILPSVTFVDVNTEKLLEKLEFDTPNINAGHLGISKQGHLAVVSAQREGLPDQKPGGITLRLAGGEFHTLKKPADLVERLLGETLSVCIHEATGVVGATTPAGNLLTFWDLKNGNLLRHYELQNPRGIELSQDDENFVVSFGAGNPPEALCIFDAETLEKRAGYDLAPTGITGSHLFSYSYFS
ncbi:MAG TPA: DUF1513 domain-containing protein [Gammaproteobacteria bacterium]|nr:DUF1513 domain-containing protein [Gammaproteobacteria bacterium]